MTLTTLHRTNAKILGLFIVLHLANHAVLLAGRESHLEVMEFIRPIYRMGLVE